MKRIEVFHRPGHFNRFSEWIPAGYRAILWDGDQFPMRDGKTVNEAVQLLCESHGLEPSHVEIVYR